MNYGLMISGLFILLAIYIGVTLFLTFGKKIPSNRKWLFSKDRKKTFIAADLALLLTFIIICYVQFEYFLEPNSTTISLVIFSFLALSNLLNAMEDLLTNKETKTHYHGWIGFGFSLSVVAILLLAI